MCRNAIHKYGSWLMACLVALTLVLSALPTARAAESDRCGESLTWSFSSGTLTVTGSGDMTDFQEITMAPWYDLRDEIISISLPEGLSSIGSLAFYGCGNLAVVRIPDSVTSIGSYAFAECTGMKMLNLGSGVQRIGEAAFSDCVSLSALQLPQGLKSIGIKAFYRCESVAALTVPAAVESIGVSAFAYCKSLVSATVNARLSILPEWMFYGCHRLVSVTLPDELEQVSEFAFRGCDQLTTVYYDGGAVTPEELEISIGTDVPGFQGTGHITDAPPPKVESAGSTQENEDGSIIQENLTATQSSNMTASVRQETVRQEEGAGISASMNIQITIENEQGWKEAQDVVTQALKDYNSNTAQLGDKEENIQIDLFIKDGDLDPDFTQLITQRDVLVTVITQDGSKWRLDGNVMQEQPEGWDLRYTLTEGSEELCQELGVSKCYELRFQNAAKVNVELLLSLGKIQAQQKATLLYREDSLTPVQTTLVDQQGNAHFYLASVTEEGEYCIAINMPQEEQAEQEVIVPKELLNSYGNPLRHTPIEYQVTGVSSSLGVSFKQFTWILIAALVACVVIVGVVVYVIQKQKLKMERTTKRRQ